MANVTRLERIEERAVWTKAGPVVSHMPDEEITALEEAASATVADPTSFGLWAFATGTWMLGTVFGAIFPPTGYAAVIPSVLVFAGVAQFIAGLFAFRRADTFSATFFCCFGSFNAAAALGYLLEARGIIAATASDAHVLAGFFLESFAFIALALALAAMRRNLAWLAVLGLVFIGYACAGLPFLANTTSGGWEVIGNIGGWFLVASAFCAYYAGMATVVNSTWKATVLPLFGEP
jgi:succinate-acetate transporter protein